MSRKHTKSGHMRDNCPTCSPEAPMGFTADWNRDGETGTPVWACNNCGHQRQRIVRITKRQAALAAMRASR